MSANAVLDGTERVLPQSLTAGFVVGASVGLLGGLIGLGGAEFRLPVLSGVFGFIALQAVIVNKALSLAVVATALPARLPERAARRRLRRMAGDRQPAGRQPPRLMLGATWATRMASATLYRVKPHCSC